MKSTSSPEYICCRRDLDLSYIGHHFGFALFQEAASNAWIGNTFRINAVRRNMNIHEQAFIFYDQLQCCHSDWQLCNELPQLLNLTTLGEIIESGSWLVTESRGKYIAVHSQFSRRSWQFNKSKGKKREKTIICRSQKRLKKPKIL